MLLSFILNLCDISINVMDKVKLYDKTFKTFIPYDRLKKAIDEVAEKLNADFNGCEDIPVLLCGDTMIESLNRELEKEREHNREKDRQLLDTLTKLAETQAALAAGQSAEKQKALAETLIEGKQMMEEEQAEPADISDEDFDEEFRDESKKRGWLQRVWDAITGKE